MDTSVVVKYLGELLPHGALAFIDKLIDVESNVSFITKIELLAWTPLISTDLEIRKEFLKGSEIYYINEKIIEIAIQIRKATKIKLPDAVIAATAINSNLILLADNDKDFDRVVPLGLKYINPKTTPG